jgi:hypothetical protein
VPRPLASWRDTPTKTAILEFVTAVTDTGSDAFVPEPDRVAVFDNDGTLSSENPYAQLAFALDRAAGCLRFRVLGRLRRWCRLHAGVGARGLRHPTPPDHRHRTLQLVVHHTDAEREFAYDTDPLLGAGTQNLLAAVADGWTVIDMAADWSTIFAPEG